MCLRIVNKIVVDEKSNDNSMIMLKSPLPETVPKGMKEAIEDESISISYQESISDSRSEQNHPNINDLQHRTPSKEKHLSEAESKEQLIPNNDENPSPKLNEAEKEIESQSIDYLKVGESPAATTTSEVVSKKTNGVMNSPVLNNKSGAVNVNGEIDVPTPLKPNIHKHTGGMPPKVPTQTPKMPEIQEQEDEDGQSEGSSPMRRLKSVPLSDQSLEAEESEEEKSVESKPVTSPKSQIEEKVIHDSPISKPKSGNGSGDVSNSSNNIR